MNKRERVISRSSFYIFPWLYFVLISHEVTNFIGIKTMNIIEAIKSGRRFKRKVWLHYPAEYKFTPDEIVADDWEVEEVSCYAGCVTITREQFDAAWRRALDVSENMEIKTQHYLYELVVRELGL